MDTKLTMQCAVAAKAVDDEEYCQQVDGGDPAPLLSVGEASSVLPSTRDIWSYWVESSKGPQR